MKIEKGIISSTQLMFLVIGLLEANTLTAAFINPITKQNTWLVLSVGGIITLFLLRVYTSLSNMFPGKNLIEINDKLYGRYLGKVVSLLYIYYFWFIFSENIRFISGFFTTYLFTNIHPGVLSTVLVLVCIYTLKKGVEVMARVVFILSSFSIIIAIIISIFTLGYIRLSNFLPLFQISPKDFLQGTNVMVSIPFGEVIVFLMFFPYVNDIKQVKKSAFLGLIIGGLYFLTIIIRNIATLGNIGSLYVLPSFQVARLINLGDAITRLEALIAVSLLFNVFSKICIFYYATILSLSHFFSLRSYEPLVIPVAIISLVMSVILFNSPVEESYYAVNIYPIYAVPFLIILPAISLVIASIKKTQ